MTKSKLKEFEFAPNIFKIFGDEVKLIGFVLISKTTGKYKAYSADGKCLGTKFISKDRAIKKLKSIK